MKKHRDTAGRTETTNTTVDSDAIHDELLERPQHLYWNADAGKPRKGFETPLADSGARWKNPDTWLSSDEALEHAADEQRFAAHRHDRPERYREKHRGGWSS